MPYCNTRGYFSASQHSSLGFVDTSSDHVLGLQGIVVCTIAKVGEKWIQKQDANFTLVYLSTIDEFCKESAALGRGVHPRDARSSQVEREEAVWRIPIGDLYYGIGSYTEHRTAKCGRTMEELHAEYARFLQMTRDIVNMRPEESSCDEFAALEHARANNCMPYMLATAKMRRRRAFLIEAGYVGMGPGLMTVGDAVVIFAGAEIPHILRRTSDKHWEYVGEAYCDGIMDGEAWVGNKELESFYLV
jgi:hypothetical protein